MTFKVIEVERNQLAFDDLNLSQEELNSSQLGGVVDRLNVALEHVQSILQQTRKEDLVELLEDCEFHLEEAISAAEHDSKWARKLKANKNKQVSKVVNETYLVYRPLQIIQKMVPQLKISFKEENLNVLFLSEVG